MKIGIIPAAGRATRFDGVLKELLPLPDGKSLLDHAVQRLSFCDRIIVVSNPDKVEAHIRALREAVGVVLQRGHEMWGAIQTAMNDFDADYYYLTMPDTWMYDNAFLGVPEITFGYGCFITEYPERFGVLVGNEFVDKPTDADVPAVAWGVLTWNRTIKELWNKQKPTNYTEAINMALKVDHRHWLIGPYFDCANAERYQELLNYLRKD